MITEEWMRMKRSQNGCPNMTSLMHLVVAHGSPGKGPVVGFTNIRSLTGIPKCMSLPKGFKPGIQFAGHLTTQFVVLLVALAQETGLLPEARFSWLSAVRLSSRQP